MVAIAHALAAFDKRDCRAGIDALITFIEEGRLDADRMAAVLGPMLGSGYLVPQRVTPRHRAAATASPLHAFMILEVLVLAIRQAGDEIDAREMCWMHHMIALVHELCVETGEAVANNQCLSFLAAIKGSGKAAKLAKTLRLLETDPIRSQQTRGASATRALEARIKRAEQ